MTYLYHYTCEQWVKDILESGFLKLTESNLKDLRKTGFDAHAYTRGELTLYKPVVWMTTAEEPDVHGLGLMSTADKTAIKITIKKQLHFKKWLKWSRENNISKEWAYFLEHGRNSGSWWISERKIYLDESVVKIENRYTGEVYYENEKFSSDKYK